MQILTVLRNILTPTILLAAGFFLLFPVITARMRGKIDLPPKRQYTFIAIGIVLLLVGISLSLLPNMGVNSGRPNSPTILGVTIRKSQENGELVYYQEVNFYDEDGNTNAVEWNLLDLSDPTQRQSIELENGVVDALPEVQKIRSKVTEPWHCNGQVYVATVEVSLVDQDGNRSERIRYTIDCN